MNDVKDEYGAVTEFWICHPDGLVTIKNRTLLIESYPEWDITG